MSHPKHVQSSILVNSFNLLQNRAFNLNLFLSFLTLYRSCLKLRSGYLGIGFNSKVDLLSCDQGLLLQVTVL
jgi:hypothetical protein